ncbi:MAG: hypothetical protein LBN27_10645 [Prevotellaceae bacterium]|jgi:hypothetical protein|nr:hypothetical protein [Prevotellaceae bacterium]
MIRTFQKILYLFVALVFSTATSFSWAAAFHAEEVSISCKKAGFYELQQIGVANIAVQQKQVNSSNHGNAGAKIFNRNTVFGTFATQLFYRNIEIQYVALAKTMKIGLPVQKIIFPSHFFF